MVWVRLDDKFPRHPKVAQLTDREFRVHVRVLCWSAEFKTLGNLPPGIFNDVAGLTRALGRKFVAVGLWDATDDPEVYVIHDALKYLKHDETNAARQAEWRKRRNRNAESNTESNGASNALPVTEDVTGEVTAPLTGARVPAGVPEPEPASPKAVVEGVVNGRTEAKGPGAKSTPSDNPEKDRAIDRLCELKRADRATRGVVVSLYGHLPPAAFVNAREAALEHGGDIGYAMGALRSMVKEGQYA